MIIYLSVHKETGEVRYEDAKCMLTEPPEKGSHPTLIEGYEWKPFYIIGHEADSKRLQLYVKKISKYLELDEPTSLTEAIQLLCRLETYSEYLGDAFVYTLTHELKAVSEEYEKHATITESEETFTRTVKFLKWD
jgi:hypothetical protein